jgi:hypothetical protein
MAQAGEIWTHYKGDAYEILNTPTWYGESTTLKTDHDGDMVVIVTAKTRETQEWRAMTFSTFSKREKIGDSLKFLDHWLCLWSGDFPFTVNEGDVLIVYFSKKDEQRIWVQNMSRFTENVVGIGPRFVKHSTQDVLDC